MNREVLISGIERCLDSMISEIDKKTLLAYGGSDLAGTSACLDEWEKEGKLEIIKPLEAASDEEIVIKVKSYIKGESPWPK